MITIDRNDKRPMLMSGETFKLLLTYKENGSAVNVSSGTVTARITSQNMEVLIDDVSQANTGNAVWASGIIEVIIPYASTADMETQDGFCVVTVTVSGTKRVLMQAIRIQEAI